MFLKGVPDYLLKDLPQEDQDAILDAVGKQVSVINQVPDSDEIEVEFVDKNGDTHTIWIDKKFVESIDYRSLMIHYMKAVIHMEGVSFVDCIPSDDTTEFEKKELVKIAKEAKAPPHEYEE